MSEYDARLTDRVRTRGVLGPDDAARLLLPVAQSLADLHAAGTAHGAVSPAAVRIASDGSASLVDASDVRPDPAYVAPDPSAGLRADPCADDVWALAAVLEFVTTGGGPGSGGVRDTGWLAPLTELALVVDPRQRPTMADMAAYLQAQVPAPEPARRPSPVVLGVVGAAVIVVLGLVGAALLFTGSDDDPDPAAKPDTPSRRTSDGPRGSEEPVDDPAATASADTVSARELEDFARSYVATASRDPQRGLRLLTPDYQAASPRYREVWAAIDSPVILSITPDPQAMTVSYTYRYALPGGVRRTEDITLRLVQRDGRLLISGASAR